MDKDLQSHEALCAERYKNILEKQDDMNQRIRSLEKILWIVVGATVLMNPSMVSMLTKLI